MHRAEDRSIERSGPTFHAEPSVIGECCGAQRRVSPEGYTLYGSAELCDVRGAIKCGRISPLVFSISQAMLQQLGIRPQRSRLASLTNRAG
jgi:tRNA(Arg) A34 adenosine deaminase TadA